MVLLPTKLTVLPSANFLLQVGDVISTWKFSAPRIEVEIPGVFLSEKSPINSQSKPPKPMLTALAHDNREEQLTSTMVCHGVQDDTSWSPTRFTIGLVIEWRLASGSVIVHHQHPALIVPCTEFVHVGWVTALSGFNQINTTCLARLRNERVRRVYRAWWAQRSCL